MNASIRLVALGGLAAVLAASCTMKDQEAPPLTGPSEFGTLRERRGHARRPAAGWRLTVGRDDHGAWPNGNPLPNLAVRAEIFSPLALVDADGNVTEIFVPAISDRCRREAS